jgi:quercetin dioxygenase-like cupin family protein
MTSIPSAPVTPTEVNADFTRVALVHAGEIDWTPSPMPGVSRRMLDRVGGEVARATSIVRYAPGSAFSAHTHGGGEEFLVLEGVFQDEHGDYPAGTYVRNPPGSSHTPASRDGCIILVKLWQFDPEDRAHVVVDTRAVPQVPQDDRPGVLLQPLFSDARENVRMEHWQPGIGVEMAPGDGLELFVVEGEIVHAGERLGVGGWLRLPVGTGLSARTGPQGARAFVKSGHLAQVAVPAA